MDHQLSSQQMDDFCHDPSGLTCSGCENGEKGKQISEKSHQYLTRNTLPFCWLRCFFHSFKVTGRFWVKLEDTKETNRGVVSVRALNKPSAGESSFVTEKQNHNYSPGSPQRISPVWFVPIGPPDHPPIFTIGMGLTAGREEVDLLAKFGQHADWLFPPTCLPPGIPVKLFHETIDHMVLFSPKWTSLDKEEMDKLGIRTQHSWLEQCVHVTRENNLEEESLSWLSEYREGKFEPVCELLLRIKQYTSKYMALDNVREVRELNAIVSLCLQLLLQTAIRRLSDFINAGLGGRSTAGGQNSSLSNLTTMTSYNSLASTTSSASGETVASNFPLKSEMVGLPTSKLRDPFPVGETNSVQVISIQLPRTPTKDSGRSITRSACSLVIDQLDSTMTNSHINAKFPLQPRSDASVKSPEFRAGDEKSEFSSPFNKLVVGRKGEVGRITSAASPFRWYSSGNLFYETHKTTDQHYQVPVSDMKFQNSAKTRVQCLSQSSPDIRIQTPTLYSRSADSVSPLKTITDVSEAMKHSFLLRPLHAEPHNKYSYSADQTNTSLSYEFPFDPNVPTVREYLRRKLLSRILVEITTQLGSTQAEVVQLLPAFHDQNVIKLVDHVIDQAVAITLTYRMNQLTNTYPSIPLSQLVTSSPVSVGLIMDKLLLKGLSETITTDMTIPSFPSYTHLHRHITGLIDTIVQANEPLRTNPKVVQIRSDIVQTALILLWNSSYPAACMAMNQLLSEHVNLENVLSSRSEAENNLLNTTSSSDHSLHNGMWTTRISNVPCHIPLIRIIPSVSDSKLTRMKTDEFGEPIIVTPRVPDANRLGTEHAGHGELSSTDLHSRSPGPVMDITDIECASPLPIVSELIRTECGGMHYVSVQSSRSESRQSKSSVNAACPLDVKEQTEINTELVQTSGKILRFRLYGMTDEFTAAIITGPQTLCVETTDDQPVQTAPDLMLSRSTDETILFCPSCTKLIRTRWNTCESIPRIPENIEYNQSTDVGVQWSTETSMGELETINTVVGNKPGPVAGTDLYTSVRRRTSSQTLELRDSKETRMVLECMIAHDRSQSQGAADERMSAQSVVYHSMSLSMCDRLPEHCTSPTRGLLGPEPVTETVLPIRNAQGIGEERTNNRINKWFKPNALEQCLSGKSDHDKNKCQRDEDCQRLGVTLVHTGSSNRLSKLRATRELKRVYNPRSNKPSSREFRTKRNAKFNNMLSITPFYTCLRELRDCLSRAESRLNVAFCDYLTAQNQRRCVQPRGDLRGRSVDPSMNTLSAARKKSSERTKISVWNSPNEDYLSSALLGKPRCQPVPLKKRSSQPIVRPRPNHSTGAIKSRSKFGHGKVHPSAFNEGGEARWTVDEIRPRGPGLFPSPSMELPVRANLNIQDDTKQLTMLGKINARRNNPSLGADLSSDRTGGTKTQSQPGRIGTILLKNGPRNTRRLCNIHDQVSN
ncbi:hypothetical protein D915_002972 [Fasciola hepatica]|uniref:Uncharacterized protein n=1 Tax=Fasciola hepatica TaxID=6192 RepID=A0A4E0RF45_FASHE|nr:hypothetical protein D915_002972 [Fasciola hepatica]